MVCEYDIFLPGGGVMAEYIEREAAKRIVDDIDTWASGWREYAKLQMDSLPAADVVPVRHGRWIWDGYVYDAPWQCSNCGVFHDVDSNYCPNCGAKMDGGKGDA